MQDFEALLSLMGDQGLPVTPSHLLALKSLETINRSLIHPLELGLKRAVQKSYPPVNGPSLDEVGRASRTPARKRSTRSSAATAPGMPPRCPSVSVA